MLQILVEKIVALGIESDVFTEDERELQIFSLIIMFEQVIVWASIFVLAFIGNRFWGTVILMLFYIPLRVYAGGFHARTFVNCFLLSVGVYVTMLIASHLLSSVPLVFWLVTAFSIVIIAVKSPIADPNKPMQEGDCKHYRKMVFCILPVELCAFAGFITWGNVQTQLFICFSFIQLAGMLLLSPLSLSKESD